VSSSAKKAFISAVIVAILVGLFSVTISEQTIRLVITIPAVVIAVVLVYFFMRDKTGEKNNKY
jgi:type III secretory pathway component EscS